MSVDLDPQELGFRRPFNHEVTETLKLRNPHQDPVAFKVKTTAPKQYCVRPNSGRIEPGGHVEVQVLLQAMKEDPPPDAKCRDKFLVQSVLVTADKEFANVTAIWQNVEKTAKSSIQERKIRVNFLAPSGASQAVNGVGSANGEDSPPAYSSPSPQFGSPATVSSSTPSRAVPMDAKPEGAKSVGEAKATTTNPATSSSVGAAAAAVTNAVPMSTEELKAQLADAKAQILKLKEQAGDSGLRQRKVNEAGEKMQTMAQQSGDVGVPLQIVAGLCLLSFLLAYFFF